MSLLVQKRNDQGEILTLYAVCAEYRISKEKLKTEIIYMHAKDAANAKFLFTAQNSTRSFRIVGIAPAIGFHVLDDHGEKLLA